MLLFMTVWANSALADNTIKRDVTQYPPVYKEKCLYSTDFQDWPNITSSDTETEISKIRMGKS